MAWDHNYRRLEKGEIIRASDEVQDDDASWQPARHCIGEEAPDPSYTSHRVYRRIKERDIYAPLVNRLRSNLES